MNLKPAERAKENSLILIEAEDFVRGTIEKNTDSYGKGIGTLIYTGYAEYEFNIKSAGKYQLESRYAAEGSRPMFFSLNGKVVKREGVRQITGGWFPQHQKWEIEGVYDLEKGKNVFRIERGEAVPHVDKFLFAKVAVDAKPDQKTASHISPRILAGWKKFLQQKSKDIDSIWHVWINQPALREKLLPVIRAGLESATKGKQKTTFRDVLYDFPVTYQSLEKLDAKKWADQIATTETSYS